MTELAHDHFSHSHWKGYDYQKSDEMKRRYIPLSSVLKAVNPVPGDIIVDVACGSGFFSISLSGNVSEVIAIDSNEAALDHLRKKIAESGTDNVTVQHGDVCGFVPESGNKVFISNAFHDLSCREAFLSNYIKKLGNPVFILIEIKHEAPIGPPGNIKISEADLDRIFAEQGYVPDYREELEMHYIRRYVRN